MTYLGNTPVTQSFISGTDYFNGTGSQTAFTLTRSVASINDIQVTVNNVVQQPNSGYTVSNTTLTFDQAPSAGTNNVYVRYLSTTTQSITPSQNTVSYSTFDQDMQSAIGTGNKNRIINGAMVIDQRNAGASVSNLDGFGVDRWYGSWTGGAGRLSAQQSTVAPAGFTNSWLLTVTATNASPASTDGNFVDQRIEGFNVADLGWGTANAKTVTISFWARSSVTGTFPLVIQNSATNRAFGATYTINAANTLEYKTITVAGDTTGTWLTNNGIGIVLRFGFSGGSSRTTSTGWNASGFITNVTGCTNFMATSGATFYLTGVQLEKGTQATSFEYRQYQQELALCQRYQSYFWIATDYITNEYAAQGVTFPVTMRATPTLSSAGTATQINISSVAAPTNGALIDTNGATIQFRSVTPALRTYYYNRFSASSEL